MANIPGLLGYNQPGVFSRVRTLTKAVSTPGGLRVLCIMGEGLREETIIDSAKGDGTDGWNPTFTAISDGYGRYFRTSNYPLIENRSELYLNDSKLKLLEDTIDGNPFSSYYDARLDPETGKIELQKAVLVDQGGAYYKEASTNVGDGYLSSLALVDENAVTETWTIRCINTLKTSGGAPIIGQATFTASGSVSGQLKDVYGQPYIWTSDGSANSNGIISFAIFNLDGHQAFAVGDRFSVQVSSRTLKQKDKLEIKYIATLDINDAQTFTDPNKLFAKHGFPSVTNALSLGAQMAFENGASSVLAIQPKPPLPRRISEIVLPAYDTVTLKGGASGSDSAEDLIFDISMPGKPDSDSEIHFFIINYSDGSEIQIFPNKHPFYNSDLANDVAAYEKDPSDTKIMDNFMNPVTSGYFYSYTVITDAYQVDQEGNDATITSIGDGSSAWFYSASGNFTNVDAYDIDLDKQIDLNGSLNNGRFQIDAIQDENTLRIIGSSGSFTNETNVKWQLISKEGTSQKILFTKDLKLASKQGLRITYIDNKDADFFDANWAEAFDVLEANDLQILVPLPAQTFSAIQQAARVHCERMSSTYYKRERVLLTGSLQGLSPENMLGENFAAIEDVGVLEGLQGDDPEEILEGNIEDLVNYDVSENFGDSFRVGYFYPDEIVRTVRGTNIFIPGYFMGAAAGGWLAGQPNISIPLTNKVLVGFTILNNKIFKDDILNKLGDNGIIVVQPVAGGGRVLHGKTTVQSGAPEEEELSIIFIRDQIARTMRRSFQIYIGSPEDATFASTLTAKAISLLTSFSSQNWITDYRNLSIERDDVEPRQWNISVEVQPNYSVNWIFIDVSVGLF